jgi:hypothetical protein
MKTIVSELDALVADLRFRKPSCVGLDGVDGVGKSETSSSIASSLGLPVICLDDYVEKNRGGYVAYIDYAALAAKITGTQKFLMEGVCLLAVVQRLGIHLDCLIYIKRMRSGHWVDKDECEFPNGVEEALRLLRRNTELVLEFEARQNGTTYNRGVTDEPGLSEEIMRYHARHSPHTVADITFCNHIR